MSSSLSVSGSNHRQSLSLSSSTASFSLREGAQRLWAAALEVWAHQLLYVRRVYPQETFSALDYAGITACRVCRHPQVVSYVREFVEAAVPSLFAWTPPENKKQRTSPATTRICLKIVERDEETETVAHEWEVYTLRVLQWNLPSLEELLNKQQQSKSKPKASAVSSARRRRSVSKQQQQRSLIFPTKTAHKNEMIHIDVDEETDETTLPTQKDLLLQLESGLRQLILKTHSLPHGHVVTANNNNLDMLSFELTLQMANEHDDASSLLVQQGLEQGKWIEVAPELVGNSSMGHNNGVATRVIRPLQVVDTALCRLDFSLRRTKVVTASSSPLPSSTNATTETTAQKQQRVHSMLRCKSRNPSQCRHRT